MLRQELGLGPGEHGMVPLDDLGQGAVQPLPLRPEQALVRGVAHHLGLKLPPRLAFGAVAPTLATWFVVLPLKGLPARDSFAWPGVLERMVSGRTKTTELERLLPWAWETERLEAAVNA